jgi:hypothetical protein
MAALFDPARKTVDVQRWINESAYETQAHDHADHYHDHRGHAHGTDISAYCLTVQQPLSWDAFHLWLGRVSRGAGEDLLRVKGILNLIGETAPVAIHGVPFSTPRSSSTPDPTPTTGRESYSSREGSIASTWKQAFSSMSLRLDRRTRPCARARSRPLANSGARCLCSIRRAIATRAGKLSIELLAYCPGSSCCRPRLSLQRCAVYYRNGSAKAETEGISMADEFDREKGGTGEVMFATIVGLLVALAFLGLPLAIIILFVLSILDQRSERASESDRKVTSTGQDRVVRYVEWSRQEQHQNAGYLGRPQARGQR